MKKFFTVLLVLAVAFSAFAQGTAETAVAKKAAYSVAMITDYGDITDQSFNQTTYEACKQYCEANGIKFAYYKPAGDSTAERVAMIEKAVDEGYNIIVMPGFAFAGAIKEAAPQNPEVKFVALDVSEYDLTGADMSNVYSMVYQEELAGYMAGYATVKLGYTKLGYLGGMAVPAVVRYGYGFLQGADDAAKELGITIDVNYVYGNQFYGDADITAYMDTWYKSGTKCVFACGGGIWTSAAEAAAKVGGKVLGVDVDQAPIIDGAYGAGMTVTSAIKGLAASTKSTLKTIIEDGKWDTIVGKVANLGLVSGTDPDANFVGIPTGNGTQWSDKFTLANYKALVADMFAGKITVSNDIANAPVLTNTNVQYLGNIK
ncbi:MAG: BMP family ABC transporter substrate-binding protein [Sphaerochaetaceae bacterium]|nr:BMP family ABC transporter substrate-binding protein [Sphaerochaetaceae bacterium]